MQTWTQEGLELRRSDIGVEAWRYEGTELWSSGDALRACIHKDIRYGTLEARCKCSDVEVWRFGALGVWRRAASVATWKYGGMEC